MNSILCCIRRSLASRMRETNFPCHSVGKRHTWSAASSSELSSTKEILTYSSESSKGPQRWSRDWSISHMRKIWESWDCLGWSREGSESSYQCIWTPDKKMDPWCLQWYQVKYRLIYRKCHLNVKDIGTDCPERLLSLCPRSYLKAIWMWSCITGCRWLWAVGLVRRSPEVLANISHSVTDLL